MDVIKVNVKQAVVTIGIESAEEALALVSFAKSRLGITESVTRPQLWAMHREASPERKIRIHRLICLVEIAGEMMMAERELELEYRSEKAAEDAVEAFLENRGDPEDDCPF